MITSYVASWYQNYSCPSVTGGQRKWFDLKKQDAVSPTYEWWKLELGCLCEGQAMAGTSYRH